MAIKYTRDKTDQGRPPRSYGPPGLSGGGVSDLKRRLFFVYVGIGGAVFALSITNVRGRADTFENQPTLRGVAVITAKEADIATLVLDMEGLQATYKPDPQTFERLNPGDRVAVLYQRSRNGRQIRIVEVGTVPIAERGLLR